MFRNATLLEIKFENYIKRYWYVLRLVFLNTSYFSNGAYLTDNFKGHGDETSKKDFY